MKTYYLVSSRNGNHIQAHYIGRSFLRSVWVVLRHMHISDAVTWHRHYRA